MLVKLELDQDTKPEDIKKSIEKMAELTSSFKPIKKTAICGECGYKGEPFVDNV